MAAAVLPTAVAGFIGVWLSLDRLRTATVQGLQQEVSARAGGLSLFFNVVTSELQFLASNPQAAEFLSRTDGERRGSLSADGPALADAYARLIRAQPDVYQIRLLDANGLERVRVDRRPNGIVVVPAFELQDKSDRYYVQQAMATPAGSVYVSPLDLNVERGQVEKPDRPVIRLATVVINRHGAVLGAVVINLHAQVLIEPVQQMVQAREGTAYLFDRSGGYLARGGEQAEGGFSMQPVAKLASVSPAVLDRLMADTFGSLSIDGAIWAHAPIEFAAAGAPAHSPRWVVALSFPEPVLLRQVLDLVKLYVVLSAALMVAAMAGYSTTRRLMGPLEDLTKEVDAIATGDFGRRVRIEGRDEIARLGERFNLMAARLQSSLAQIQQHRERLEGEVADRTRDLVAERARLAAVLRHASDAIAALRADGELLFANRAAEELLGPSMGTDAQPSAQVLRRLVGDARSGREEIVVNRRTLSVSRDTLPAAGDSGDLVIVARDVTEEHRLLDEKREFDRQVFQLDKLATLGELAMGLAHEIGNPLAGMKAVVQAALLEHGLPEETADDLRRLESEVDRLTLFLSSFHRLAAPPQLRLAAQQLGPAVDDMLFWIRKPARTAGVELTVEIDKSLPPLSADAAQLRQVLLNLFVNSLHAMPSGGRLWVRAHEHEGEVVIEVGDTGGGIPLELQERIFKPFFTTRPAGSGLGLAVCAQVVADHRGRIEVRSQPGDTRFFVHWPGCAMPHEPQVPVA